MQGHLVTQTWDCFLKAGGGGQPALVGLYMMPTWYQSPFRSHKLIQAQQIQVPCERRPHNCLQHQKPSTQRWRHEPC